MQTNLDINISSVDDAKAFLSELSKNREAYHPEDNAHNIQWNFSKDRWPTSEECDKLNLLMDRIYQLDSNFDPCEYLFYLQ